MEGWPRPPAEEGPGRAEPPAQGQQDQQQPVPQQQRPPPRQHQQAATAAAAPNRSPFDPLGRWSPSGLLRLSLMPLAVGGRARANGIAEGAQLDNWQECFGESSRLSEVFAAVDAALQRQGSQLALASSGSPYVLLVLQPLVGGIALRQVDQFGPEAEHRTLEELGIRHSMLLGVMPHLQGHAQPASRITAQRRAVGAASAAARAATQRECIQLEVFLSSRHSVDRATLRVDRDATLWALYAEVDAALGERLRKAEGTSSGGGSAGAGSSSSGSAGAGSSNSSSGGGASSGGSDGGSDGGSSTKPPSGNAKAQNGGTPVAAALPPFLLVVPHPRRELLPIMAARTLRQLGLQTGARLIMVPRRRGHNPSSLQPPPTTPPLSAGQGSSTGDQAPQHPDTAPAAQQHVPCGAARPGASAAARTTGRRPSWREFRLEVLLSGKHSIERVEVIVDMDATMPVLYAAVDAALREWLGKAGSSSGAGSGGGGSSSGSASGEGSRSSGGVQGTESAAAAEAHTGGTAAALPPYLLVVPHPRQELLPSDTRRTLRELGLQTGARLVVMPDSRGYSLSKPQLPPQSSLQPPANPPRQPVAAAADARPVHRNPVNREIEFEIKLLSGKVLITRLLGSACLHQLFAFVNHNRTDGNQAYNLVWPGRGHVFDYRREGYRSLSSLGLGDSPGCICLALEPGPERQLQGMRHKPGLLLLVGVLVAAAALGAVAMMGWRRLKERQRSKEKWQDKWAWTGLGVWQGEGKGGQKKEKKARNKEKPAVK